MRDLEFLQATVQGKIDVNSLRSEIILSAKREAARSSNVLYCRTATKNVTRNTPLRRMCEEFNKTLNDLDILENRIKISQLMLKY